MKDFSKIPIHDLNLFDKVGSNPSSRATSLEDVEQNEALHNYETRATVYWPCIRASTGKSFPGTMRLLDVQKHCSYSLLPRRVLRRR
jgi:hypothetical protein